MKFYDPDRAKNKINAKRAAKGLPPLTGTIWEISKQQAAERNQAKGLAAPDTTHQFIALNVRIDTNGDVYPTGLRSHAKLGPLAEAHAELGTPASHHRLSDSVAATAVIGPLGLIGAATKKTTHEAYVVFADGTVHTAKAANGIASRVLQRDVVKFNALAAAAAAGTTAGGSSEPVAADPAARLAQVTQLHDTGLLTDTEYETKRAEVVAAL